LESVKPKTGSKIYLLGNEKPLEWEINAEGKTEIKTPESLLTQIPDDLKLAYSFKIEI
jgi:hypothetical protein